MPDILTHALVGYVLGTALAVRYDWFKPHHVTLVMLGTTVPDFDKVSLVLDDAAVESALGLPFSWLAIHLPIGSLIVCSIGALLVGQQYRKRAFALLIVGALSHYALDSLSVFTTGYSYPYLWPLSEYYFPAAGLYQSSDQWPAALAGLAAAATYVIKRYRA
jgi:membrane-bound metal-dependent hydrolase YbcI (DUF457 family)